MKKISILVIAMALLLCLTGCPTSHADYPVGIYPGYMMGSQDSINNQELVWNGSEATVEFTYSNSTEKWGSGDGSVQFGITSDTSWSTKWVGATLTANDVYETTANSGANNRINDLEEGKNYRITVKGGPVVRVKVDEI